MKLDEASKRVSEIKKEIRKLIEEAEGICDASGLDSFHLKVAYGMGGSYRPDPRRVEEWEGSPEDYEIGKDGGVYRYDYSDDFHEGGYWESSSSRC